MCSSSSWIGSTRPPPPDRGHSVRAPNPLAHQTREMIGSFIEEVYNRQRLHSALAYQPPAEFEANLHSQEGAMTTASRSLATALSGARSLAACPPDPNHQPGTQPAA